MLNLHGLITQRSNPFSGGTSCEFFSSQLREAVADDTASQILISVNSPGGSVFGPHELFSEIMQARTVKPIIGIVDSQCASAAYWIAAACSELFCTPGGEVGSIGVWQAHEDMSEAMADAGVKTTLVSAGKFKTEGNPIEPLTPEAKGFMQSRVNEYYRSFTAAVARGRGVPVAKVRDGMGQGRMLGASAALSEKMIDGVASLNEVIGGMQRNIRSGANSAKSMSTAVRMAAIQREVELLELECGVPPRLTLAQMRRELDAISQKQ